MLVRGLLGRRLIHSISGRFGFAEANKLAKQQNNKQAVAKKPTNMASQEVLDLAQEKLPFGQDIPEQQLLTAEEMKYQTKLLRRNFGELEKKLSDFQKYQLIEVADHILELKFPAFLHYLVRNEPEVREVFPDKELHAADTKVFVEKLRKPQIKPVEIKPLAAKKEAVKAAPPKEDKSKPQAGKPPADKAQKGGKK